MIGPDLLTIPAQSQALLGKNVSELIGDDVRVLKDGSVLGTLHKVEEFPEYWPGNEEAQKGYFFPARLPQEGTTLTTDNDGVQKEQAFPDDGFLVAKIAGTGSKLKIGVDGKDITTLTFADAKFEGM